MINADTLRGYTNKAAKRAKANSWRKIKHRIKVTSKKGEFYTVFDEDELNEEFISILDALGYKTTLCKSCFLLMPNYYTVSWEHPQEYWDDDKFKLD